MEIKNLNEVCMINMGQSPDSSSYNDKKEGLAFYQGNADFGEIHPTTRVWCNNPIKIAEKDDILISVRAPIGSMNIANEKCCIGRGLASIKPIDKNECNQNYLYYFLESKVPYMQSKGTGSTFKAINKGILTSLQIKLPNIREQEKISSIISKIKAQIHNKKLQIRKYDELVKSQFIEMFGDPDLSQQKESWDELENVGEIVGGSTPKTSIKEYWDGDLNWFTPAEIKDNDFIVNQSERKITELGAKSCSLRKMPINTVILSSRAPIGKVALAGCEFYCNQGFKNIVCNENLNPIFLLMLLKYNNEYLNSLGRGATFKEISKTIVSKIKIPTPPIELQNQFADFVKHIDKLKFTIKQSIEKLELCYKSLMKQYFD